MDNQHKKIKGYRDLSQQEIDLMNEAKHLSELVGDFVEKLNKADFADTSDQVPDKRWVNIGTTHLQQGFMSIVRAIAKPTTF